MLPIFDMTESSWTMQPSTEPLPSSHVHCICSRSRLTRKPGKWCGAALDCDPDRSAEVEAGSVPTDGSDGYVDAYNTMIPGHQG